AARGDGAARSNPPLAAQPGDLGLAHEHAHRYRAALALPPSRLPFRSPLRLRLPLRPAGLLGMETLRQLLAPRAAIPLLERLGRDLALDQQLRELPSLRLALDRHARTSAAPLPRKPRPLPHPP